MTGLTNEHKGSTGSVVPLIYAHSAKEYLRSGLGAPLPLPPLRKVPPPTGYTGKVGKVPTAARVGRWAREKPARTNVALRLAPGVLGLDVDAYAPKRGGATLAVAQDRWGTLPATVRSSARSDGVSGIYLYRMPLDLVWPSVLTADLSGQGLPGHVELVHAGLRYAVCWPSLHPKGGRYWWWDDGGKLQEVPSLQDLPWLPDRWVSGLTALRLDDGRRAVTTRSSGKRHVVARRDCRDEPCPQFGGASDLAALADVVRGTAIGWRNEVLNRVAFHLGGDDRSDHDQARLLLVAAAREAGLSAREAASTFDSGWAAGRNRPYR